MDCFIERTSLSEKFIPIQAICKRLALFSLFSFFQVYVCLVFSGSLRRREAISPLTSPRFKIKWAGTQTKQHHKGSAVSIAYVLSV